MMQESLTAGQPRMLLEQAALALLDYIEQSSDGFRILVRDSPIGSASGSFVSIIGDVATRVEHILAAEFKARGFDAKAAPMYAQMLVGMVGTTGQWWLDARKPSKEAVAAHLVNLAWHGLAGLEKKPRLRSQSLTRRAEDRRPPRPSEPVASWAELVPHWCDRPRRDRGAAVLAGQPHLRRAGRRRHLVVQARHQPRLGTVSAR